MPPTFSDPPTFLVNGFGAVHGGIVRVHNEICSGLAAHGQLFVASAPRDQWDVPNSVILSRQSESRLRSFLSDAWSARRRLQVGIRIDSAPAFRLRTKARKRVVVVHDLNFLHPDIHGISRRQVAYRRLLHAWSLRRVDLIVANSTQTAREIYRLMPRASKSVQVLPLPVSEFARAEIKSVSFSVGIEALTLLSFGHATNKGVDRLFEVLSHRPGWTLKLVAPEHVWEKTWKAAAESHGITDRVHLLAGISDQELSDEYCKADVFCMLSTYEGYGLPVAEAIAMGVPTVISALPVLSETARRRATVAQGKHWTDDVEAIEKAVTMSPERRIAGALEIRSWTWQAWIERIMTEIG